eukprot:3581289-Alexandrium_andersonii.AAC.1
MEQVEQARESAPTYRLQQYLHRYGEFIKEPPPDTRVWHPWGPRKPPEDPPIDEQELLRALRKARAKAAGPDGLLAHHLLCQPSQRHD